MKKWEFIRFVFRSGFKGLGSAGVASLLFGIALYEHLAASPPIPPVSEYYFFGVGVVALFFGAYAAWAQCEVELLAKVAELDRAEQDRNDARSQREHAESARDHADRQLLLAQTRLSQIEPHIILTVQYSELEKALPDTKVSLFALLHANGRNATYAEIDPILSNSGNFEMTFKGVALIDPGKSYPVEQAVQPVDRPRFEPDGRSIWNAEKFFADSLSLHYEIDVTLRFMDGEKSLSKRFKLQCNSDHMSLMKFRPA